MKDYLDAILSENRPYLLKAARRYRSIMDPEDLVQEVSVKLWEFFKGLGATAEAFDTDTIKKLCNTLVKNVALSESKQDKFERALVHGDIFAPHDISFCEDKLPEYIEYINTHSSGHTKLIFNILVNIFANKIHLKKKDIYNILNIKPSTFGYHMDKIRQLSLEFKSVQSQE